MNLSFSKFKILWINIFITLLKAATLNPYKLQSQLDEVEHYLHSDCELYHLVLLEIISLYLQIKFVLGYLTLAGNIIAMFPILAEHLPHLLLPAIFAQTLDHIALNIGEILIGFATIKYNSKQSINNVIFGIFIMNKFCKIVMAVTALNIYSDFYQQLSLKSTDLIYIESDESNENIILEQSLF